MASNTAKKFRVLVVDDSAFMRKVLESIFNHDEQLQVVGHAKDGREAIALSESLKPDVITMDLNMPHMDGLQATAHIMTNSPRPIVIVSSESKEGAASTLKALELGAIEFVTKPSGGIDLDMQSVKDELLRTPFRLLQPADPHSPEPRRRPRLLQPAAAIIFGSPSLFLRLRLVDPPPSCAWLRASRAIFRAR